MSTFIKDPDAVLDYGFDWGIDPWLSPGEIIQSSTWTSTPAGLTLSSPSYTDTVTVVWISGGVLGQKYLVTNRITTSQGRTEDRTIVIVVRER